MAETCSVHRRGRRSDLDSDPPGDRGWNSHVAENSDRLTISGKSREEEIGNILPEGWQLSLVTSPLPVALDENGKMKAQVRPGTWPIRIDAFRNRDLDTLRFTDGLTPAVDQELVGIRVQPNLRTVELQGAFPIDVQMTTFPEVWRDLPVYEWKTDSSLQWVEKTRGMGASQPTKLAIRRQLWLDEDGSAITYHDQIQGQPKGIARVDVAEGHELEWFVSMAYDNSLRKIQRADLMALNFGPQTRI